MDKPFLMDFALRFFPRLTGGTGGGGGVLLSCGFWWVFGRMVLAVALMLRNAERFMDKGGAIMYQTGKGLPA